MSFSDTPARHSNKTSKTAEEISDQIDELRSDIQNLATTVTNVAGKQLTRAQDSLDSARMSMAARESELASARVEHEWRAREVRTREQQLAGMSARLHSLEEIDTHRGGFADAARMVLVNANGRVGQMGAVADFIEVEPRYERAVEACMGDLLQHILVERLEHVSAGLKLIRQEDAGRCGFIVGKPTEGTEFQIVSTEGTERGGRHPAASRHLSNRQHVTHVFQSAPHGA